MKKKIAIVITRMIRGGAAQVVESIMDYGKEEFDFTLFTGREGISNQDITQLGNKYNLILVNSLFRQISPFKDYLAYRQMRREFIRGNFDIVHTHTSKAGFIGRLAARDAAIRKIIHNTHGSIYMPESRIPGVPDLNFYKNILLKAEKYVGKYTDFQIVLSQTEYNFSVRTGLSKNDNTIIIPNGIIPEDFLFDEKEKSFFRKELFPDCDDSTKIILCAGRLSSEKGQSVLIDAFKGLKEENKAQKIKLVFVGDGPDRKFLEEKSFPHNYAGEILFCGYQSELRKYYAAADIYVQPSFYEGFGISLVEAMASGLPCIASSAGAMPEIITDFENGLLFPTGDSNILKEKISILINSPEIASKISKNAKLSVKKFDLKVILEQYYKLYKGDK